MFLSSAPYRTALILVNLTMLLQHHPIEYEAPMQWEIGLRMKDFGTCLCR
jgi:hypothetical protein